MIRMTTRQRELDRWTTNQESVIIPAVMKQTKNKGLFYAKGGCGIERNPNSKRKPNDAFNMRRVKGKLGYYKGIFREKSKAEFKALEEKE